MSEQIVGQRELSRQSVTQALTRCVAQDQKLFGWLKAMYAGWQHISVGTPALALSSPRLSAGIRVPQPHVEASGTAQNLRLVGHPPEAWPLQLKFKC